MDPKLLVTFRGSNPRKPRLVAPPEARTPISTLRTYSVCRKALRRQQRQSSAICKPLAIRLSAA